MGEMGFDILPDGDPQRLQGVVRYEDRPYSSAGFSGELQERGARGVAVHLFSTRGEKLQTVYSGAEGEFAFSLAGLVGERLYVELESRSQVGALSFEVQDARRAEALYRQRSEPFVAAEHALFWRVAAPASSELGAALHIVDVAYDALVMMQRIPLGASPPPLRLRWAPSYTFSCASCFSAELQTISLGGGADDPDEFDDDIILHEIGHYFLSNFSRDSSPGGSHRDRRVIPTLAYTEGAAYFFAAMAHGSPAIVDVSAAGVRFIELDGVSQQGEMREDFRGTSTGNVFGELREEVVAGILWDSFDPASAAEAFDQVQLDTEGMLRLWTDLRAEGLADRGATGVDLPDWLDRALASGVAPLALQRLLDDRAYPLRLVD